MTNTGYGLNSTARLATRAGAPPAICGEITKLIFRVNTSHCGTGGETLSRALVKQQHRSVVLCNREDGLADYARVGHCAGRFDVRSERTSPLCQIGRASCRERELMVVVEV